MHGWVERLFVPAMRALTNRAMTVLADTPSGQPVADRPLGYVPAGRKLTLRCPDRDCWIDRIDVISGGGAPRRAPACPNCHGAMAPESTL